MTTCSAGIDSGAGLLALVLLHLLLELGDHQREVVADELRARGGSGSPPMIVDGITSSEDRGARAERVGDAGRRAAHRRSRR